MAARACPPSWAATACPATVQWAAAELILGANPAVFMYLAGPRFAAIVHRNGTPEQQRWAELMIERGWGATMVLTEPDAGSDVGAGRTRAVAPARRHLAPRGREAVHHLGRARPDREHHAPGAGPPRGPGIDPQPGTKGLSLFLVPKFHFDPATGELGERNGAFVTNVEHKMGLKASATCELTFGQHGVPAVGYLLGEVHDGIAQMFQVIEYARMMVGTKAIATLSAGYLDRAGVRQGARAGRRPDAEADKTAPRVTITHHPDVRRMPDAAEGLRRGPARASTSTRRRWQDRRSGPAAPTRGAAASASTTCCCRSSRASARERASARCSCCRCRSSAAPATCRTTRSSSTSATRRSTRCTRAPPRSSRWTSCSARSSGTTGPALGASSARSQGSSPPEARQRAAQGGARAAGAPRWPTCRACWARSPGTSPSAIASRRELHGRASTRVRLLMAVGDLLVGWLLLRQAEVALAALGGETGRDQAFYEGKVAVARFFAATQLPLLTRRSARSSSTPTTRLMERAGGGVLTPCRSARDVALRAARARPRAGRCGPSPGRRC